MKTMKAILLLSLFALVSADAPHVTLDDFHDFETIVEDPVLLKEYIDCFLETGPCNEVQLSLRSNMPEAVPEVCARCNENQMHMFRVFLDGTKKLYPNEYQAYREKYDPAGTSFDALVEKVSKY